MTEDVEQILKTASVAVEFTSLSASYTTMYLTFLFGYLIVAYMYGKQMRRSQVVIITTLFFVWSLVNTRAAFLALEQAYFFSQAYGLGRAPKSGPIIVATIQGLGALAALKFMWDVRHR